MANKEKIDYLLLDIRGLENLIAGIRDTEVYPASFFSETFHLTHKILKELHSLEELQIEALRKQMEEHQRLMASIPVQNPPPIPEIPAPVAPIEPELVRKEEEIIEEKIVECTIPAEETPAEEKVVIAEQPVHLSYPEIPYKTILSEKQGISLNEILEKQNLSDFRKAFSLNDRFRFRRELFGGDEEKMNKAITDLNEIHTYEESVTYLNNVLQWNIEDASVADFITLLEKRFL